MIIITDITKSICPRDLPISSRCPRPPPAPSNSPAIKARHENAQAINGGTVELVAAAPADTTTLFIQKSVDASATQEPWGYILETQANGNLLLDWETFAWGKESTNTVVAASKKFLEDDDLAKAYLTAHVKAVDFIKENPTESQELVIKHIKGLTGKEINKDELQVAFERLEVTTEVNEGVIQEMADISKEAGYVTSNDIEGMVQLEKIKSLEQ